MNSYVKFYDFWWEYDVKTPKEEATLINLVGGRNSGVDITKCKIVKANDFEELDWNNTKVLDSKYKYGWLDRQGIFYGCDYYCHDMQAQLVHHSTRRQLEKLGWIHISKDMLSHQLKAQFFGDYKNGIMPTDAQMMYLCRHRDIQSDYVMFAYENGNRVKARIYEQSLANEDNDVMEK